MRRLLFAILALGAFAAIGRVSARSSEQRALRVEPKSLAR